MPNYLVECRGDVRELYQVEADSAQEAMANWTKGTLYVQESSSVEPVSAELDGED